MSDDSFAANRRRALRAPLAGPNGQAWATALGSAQDDEMVPLRVAAVARSTLKAPDDALVPVVGAGYLLPIAPREMLNLPAYRARLASAWPFWESAPLAVGGVTTLLEVYTPTGQPPSGALIYSGAAAGVPGWYSVYSVVWPSYLQPDGTWGSSGTWGDGGLWGIAYDPANPFTAPSFGVADADWIRREIRTIKGASAYPVVIAIGLGFDSHGSATMWGDGGTWGDGGVWGDPDPSLVVYLTIGHVWGEELRYGGGLGLWGELGDTWDDFEPPTGGW